MANTPRWGHPYPIGTDPPAGHTEIRDLALSLDDVAKDDQGTLASRPVSTAPSPGKKGRYYMVKGDATTGNNGILWRDNGTGWDQVGGGGTVFDTRANRPAAGAVPVGTRFFATDQLSEWITDGTNWFRLGDQAGDIVWTNEAVRTGYILLSGQAWPATDGIYTDLHTLWGGANLPDFRGRAPVSKGTHADVSTLLNSEGVAVANRRPKHRHTPHHHTYVHGFTAGSGDGVTTGAGTPATANTSDVDGGSGVGTDPLDAPAYLVLQPQAKL